jgi:VWFA-related protein
MSSALAFLAVLAALLFPAALAAQPPASEPTFSESLDVRVAEVEVVVTGPDGKPAQGLTREDFQVLEDGRPAEVTSVAAASFRPLALAVFLDETSLAGPARSTALAGLRKFLASGLKPGDRALLARWDGSLAIQEEWTGDAAALVAALGRIGASAPRSRPALQERNAVRQEIQQAPPFDEERGNGIIIAQAEAALANLRLYAQTRADGTRAALGALQQTLALLAGSPDRKVLLYVGGGLPLRPGADLFDIWLAKYSQLASRLAVSPFEATRFDATPLVQQMVERSNAAGISIYALALPESGAASADRPATAGGDGEDAARALRTLATGTGGRVTTDVQNPAAFLAGTERDLAGAYSIGYTPPPGGKTGRHRIEIRVRGGALAARYREERFDALDPLLQKAVAALGNAGGGANPLKLELAVEEEMKEKDGRLKVVAVASLPLSTLAVQPQEHYHVAHLTLAVAARDGKGKISGIPRAEVPVEIPNERLLAAPGEAAGYRFTLHLAPGESMVAVAARDDAGGNDSVLRAVYKGLGTGFTASPVAGSGRPEKSAERPAAGTQVESAALLMSGQEGGEIPLMALALPVPGEEGKVHVLVRVRMDGPALLAGQTGDSMRVETALYALGSGGGIQASLLENVELGLAPQREAVRRSGVDLLGSLDLKPGTYSLRLLARNAATGRLGVRTLPLAVPDPKGLDTAGLQPPPAEEPRPTVRTSGLGPLDPPPFPTDAAVASQAAPAPLPLPETAEGRRTRAALRTAYREGLARLAAGRPEEAVAAVASLEDSRLRQAGWPAEINRLVEIEVQAAGELAAVDPECLVPLLRLHQRLYEEATLKHRLAGSSVARDVAFHLIDLLRPRAPKLARRFTSTLGIELLRGGLKSSGEPAIRRALEEDPGDEVILLELAADAERRSDHAAAVPRLEELLRAHPENREARLRLAIDLGRVGRPQESATLLEALIREEPAGWRLSLAFQELARLRNAQGVPSAAIQILRQGLERLPGDEKLTLLLAAALEKSVGSAAAGEILAAFRPEGDTGGGAARHRYNDRPEEPLAVALGDLEREAAARRPALARTLEKTPP